jgi:hypothetical protein
MKVATIDSGHYLVGELLSHGPGREYKSKTGEARQPYEVKVLVGTTVVSVQYGSEPDAHAAMGKDPQPRKLVQLRVFLRIVAGKGAPWIAYAGARRAEAQAA